MAQRLARTLCKDCKEEYHPTKEEFAELKREYEDEASWEKNIAPIFKYNDDLLLYRPKGCPNCHNTGYRGRMGLHELLMGTDEMKKLIQVKAKMEDLRVQAIKDGMTTLKQDGIHKILAGYLDLLQVRKVCIK
jgi:type II secretory ATPase GspE/PulE/Tfp pilus assembly ATPase PilB-like protein